jgi:hypothetical protein
MKKYKSYTKSKAVRHILILSLCGGMSLAVNHLAYADDAKTYSRAPMAAYNYAMDDALLGNSYEKPVWNLHDTLKLPDWLTVGVENRTRYESIGNTFKPATNSRGANVYNSLGDQAIEIQTDLWVQAKFGHYSLATEFLDARAVGTDSHSYINNNSVDTVDFVQAYGSWADTNVLNSGLGAEVKVGRQTMDLGSRRLVARPIYRNTPNSFTGVRARVLHAGDWQFNSFATLPVVRFPTGTTSTSLTQLNNDVQQFDQEATRTWFSGGILEKSNLISTVNSELYLYNLDEGDSWLNATHKRRYFTPGIRFYMKPQKGQFDFQAEGMGQFGTVRNSTTVGQDRTHEAWSSHDEIGYTFDHPWNPRFFLEYDYASGSTNMRTGTDGRFDPLYGASDVDFGPSSIWAAFQRTNINSPGYKFDFAPRSDLSFRLSERLVWLASANDCWGGASCFSSTVPVLVANHALSGVTSAAGSGKVGNASSYVGNQLGFTGRYNLNTSWNFEAGWYHLFKGEFAKDSVSALYSGSGKATVGGSTPGIDSNYFYLTSQLRF